MIQPRRFGLLPLVLLALALYLLGCALGRPEAGEACEVEADGTSDCIDEEQCLGGYCAGGSCPCERGWECRIVSGFIFDSKFCDLPCSGNADCPDTWGCYEGYCAFPRQREVEIEGPTMVRSGETATYRAVVDSVAEESSYSWAVSGAAMAPTVSDESTVMVTFTEGSAAQVILVVFDTIQPSGTSVTLDITLTQ